MKLRDKLNEEYSIIDCIPSSNLLTEAGLSRIIHKIKQEKRDFAVITAYRDEYTKKENIQRNRNLRSEFNQRKMGVYQLVGHWRECQIPDVEYKDCPKNQLKDVVERSYLVVRPHDMTQEKFKDLIVMLTKKFEQDGSVISIDGDIRVLEKTGSSFQIGTKMTLGKIAQAYSQHVKKINVPFVFEAEVPSTNIGRMIFDNYGVLYPRI